MALPRIKSLADEAFYIPNFITCDEEERLLHKVDSCHYYSGVLNFLPSLLCLLPHFPPSLSLMLD
jgi:hypothetical protein